MKVRCFNRKYTSGSFANPDVSTISVDDTGNYHSFNDQSCILHNDMELWCNHGKPHREMGPAKIFEAIDVIEWYIDGDLYDFEGYCHTMGYSTKEQAYLLLIYSEYKDGADYLSAEYNF